MPRTIRMILLVLLCTRPLHGADWRWEWRPGEAEAVPAVEITPFKYGKTFAYGLEMDDNPISMVTVAQPMLAKQTFTDAPPGVAGGKKMPFVGSAAIIAARLDIPDQSYVHTPDLLKLKSAGWGILSHSYFHAGRPWTKPPELLSADQIRFDLSWSQTILASKLGGRAPTHFAYPNGYFAYSEHLHEFGMISGSRSAGTGGQDPYTGNLLDMPRVLLDERVWSTTGKSDPMWRFPLPDGPAEGQILVDFTHDMNPDPASDNHQRWQQRLQTIGATFGSQGNDSIWSTRSDEIYAYVVAAQSAKLKAERGAVTLTLPETAPAASLTVKLTGIDENIPLKAPEGGLLYRRGNVVWITTPMLGQTGAPPPTPRVLRIYEGPVRDVTFDSPVKLAAVRVLQTGHVPEEFRMSIEAISSAGQSMQIIPNEQQRLSRTWTMWRLFGPVPLRPAIETKQLKISTHETFSAMEIWAVEE